MNNQMTSKSEYILVAFLSVSLLLVIVTRAAISTVS